MLSKLLLLLFEASVSIRFGLFLAALRADSGFILADT